MLILYKMGHITIDGEQFYVESRIYKSHYESIKRYRDNPKNKEKHKMKLKELHKKENDKIQKELDEYFKNTGHKINQDTRRRGRTPSQNKYFEPDDNFICECGSKIKYYVNYKRHLNSEKHNKYINYKESFDKLTLNPDFNIFDN